MGEPFACTAGPIRAKLAEHRVVLGESVMTIFVSYKHQDEAAYTNLCVALDGSGVKRWDPETMAVGKSIADQLCEAIRVCEGCIFLATTRSVSSQWCMAEIGAFWGAGKQVIVFLADPELSETKLPVQLQGNLWTRDARKVLDSVRSLAATVPDDVLTPDLVLLLRYLERDNQWILPDYYGKSLVLANGVADDLNSDQLRGWKRAVRYGLLILAYHRLAKKQVDTSVTYCITELGKQILSSASVQERFKETFARELRPLSGQEL